MDVKQELERSGAYESFMEMGFSQEGMGKYKYMDTVIESVQITEVQAKLIQRLYDDILSKKTFDTSDIDDSKGNILKLKNYEITHRTIDNLNSLLGNKKSNVMNLTNEILSYLIKFRPDYEYGYKTDNDVIKSYYQVTVYSLMEMINYSAMEIFEDMRQSAGGIVPGLPQRNAKKFIGIASRLAKSYRSGSWSKLITQIKKSDISSSTTNIKNKSVTESLSDVAGFIDTLKNFMTGMIGTKKSSIARTVILLISIAVSGVALFSIVWLIISTLRLAIYWFYSANANLAEYLETQASILDYNIQSNTFADNEKKENALKKIRVVISFIKSKILKTESKMEQEINESNRENFSKDEIREMNSVDDDGVVFF